MSLNRNQDFMFEDTTTLTTNAQSVKGALNEVNASLASNAIQANTGSNDYNKIQNAINSSGVNGVIKLKQGGNYSITQTLNLQSNMTLDGNGSTLTATASFSLLKAYGTLYDVTLQALTVDATNNTNVLTVANASGFSVGDDIYVFPNDGTNDTNVNNNVEYNTITAISGNQLTLKNQLADTYTVAKQYSVKKCTFVQNITIKNVNFVHFDQTSTSLILDLYLVKNVTFVGCTFTNFYRNIINNSVNVWIKENTFTNCNNSLNFSKSKRVKIEKNEITGCTSNGIAVTYFCDSFYITGNEIKNIGNYGLWYNYWNDNGIIKENRITNCTGYGICHDYDNFNSLITGNDISNCGMTLLGMSSVNTFIGHHKVIGNTFRDSKFTGFTLEVVSNCVVEGNIFRNLVNDTTTSAIVINPVTGNNGASYNIISNNIFDNISGYAIKTTNSYTTVKNQIINNIFTNCSFGTLRLNTNDSDYVIKNNKGMKVTYTSTNNHTYDAVIQSPEFVFSGGTQSYIVNLPKANTNIMNAYIIYTEATSADAGTTIQVGTISTPNSYVNSTTTESSKTLGSTTSLNGNILSSTMAAGTPIQIKCTGGKTGLGKGIVVLECVYY